MAFEHETRPLSSLLALALTVLAPGLSYGGEIDIHYTDLGKKLELTATQQNGNEIGNPTCLRLVVRY